MSQANIKTLCSPLLITAIWLLQLNFMRAQLIINIKNNGGEVFQEKIQSNVSEDVIELEYRNTDGSVITQLIDFRNVIYS